MSPTEYVKNVLITEARDFTPVIRRLNDVKNLRLLHSCIGISSELSEIIEIEKNFNFVENKLDRVNLMEELSDVMWYIGIAADALDAVDEIFAENETRAAYVKYNDDLSNYISHFALNVGLISGELVDLAVKKNIFYGRKVDESKIIQMLKNIHFNVAHLLESAGFTVETARVRNIEKLRARYGEKFTEAAANERNLEVERAVLEKTAD